MITDKQKLQAKEPMTIDSSNEYDIRCVGGEAARAKAESVAKAYFDLVE